MNMTVNKQTLEDRRYRAMMYAWERALEREGIDPLSKLVVFSLSNPWAALYDWASCRLMEHR